MKAFYDFHIHSSLSPCADDDMTPLNIVAMASIKGLNAIAISDHNSIRNVKTAINCGKDFGIEVLPAIEVQTSEEIHVLALFCDYLSLKSFFSSLDFLQIKNKPEIFGNQLIIDVDDKIIANEENLLLTSAKQNIYTVVSSIKRHNGVAIPAHIDREQNGIIAILGDIPSDLDIEIIEISNAKDRDIQERYRKYMQLYNSDAHRLQDINNANNYIEVEELTAKAVLNNLKKGKICQI